MFSLKYEENYIKRVLVVISVIFFIICMYSVLKYGDANLMGSYETMNNDDVKYIRSAWTLIDKGTLTYKNPDEPTVFIMPGITCTLAFFMRIFGKFGGITAFRVFQAVLQVLSLYLIFFIGRKAAGSKVGLGACIIDILYIPEYYAPTLILTETIFRFLLLLLVYVSIYAIEEKRALYYTIGGFIWGITCLFRPTIAAYPAVILVMWIIKRYKVGDIIKYTLLTAGVFCLIMSPWWIRNYRVFKEFIPTTISSGNPFLQGTYVNYNKTEPRTPFKQGKTETEMDNNQMETGLYRLKTYAVKEPLKYLYWYTIGKSFYFWNGPFYWREIFNVTFKTAVKYHILILLISAAGIFLMIIKRNRKLLFLLLVIIYFNLIHLPFFTFSRYSYPVMSLCCTISAYILVYLLEFGGRMLWKKIRY